MSHRIYIEPESTELRVGQTVALNPERSNYVARVLRAQTGDTFLCFDGTGAEYRARVDQADPKSARLAIEAMERRLEAPSTRLVLLASVVKDRVEWMAQKATELGVTSIVFVTSARTHARLPKRIRLQRVIRSACEQSGRVWLPELDLDLKFAAALERHAAARNLIAVPGADAADLSSEAVSTSIAIGPEGGWTPAEVNEAERRGFEAVGFGALTLRSTTAAVTGLTLVRQAWAWQTPAV